MTNDLATPSAHVRHAKTVCPYCGVGCGMVLHVKDERVVSVAGDKKHPANFGCLCTKGLSCAETLTTKDRLTSAFARASKDSERERISMDTALRMTAERFQEIIKRHGPDTVALYVSGQLSLEAQYLACKLAKGFLGTNNIDSNSRLCMSSAASGYKLSLGADGPPGSYQDIDQLDCALVIGANMAECHPILFLRLLNRQKRNAKIIVVDPRRTPTADKADLFLQIKPGTDLALLNGLLHLLRANGAVNEEFISQYVEGWEELSALLGNYPPRRVAEITGLSEADIRTAAKWIGESPEFTTFWTMGLNQSTHGTWHTNAICNLHLATGKICRPGSGPFSLTGQPNAMGGREVGYMSHALPGQRDVTRVSDREFIEKLWGLPPHSIRSTPGLDAVALFKGLEAGEVKAVWIIGTNPVASMPNRQRVIRGLERAELVVVQDAYHPTETSRYADILLPGALWAEAEGTMVNSERCVTLMERAVSPPGDALPDWQIIKEVAGYMGFEKSFPYKNSAAVFDEIRQLRNTKTGYDLGGISHERLQNHTQQWPCDTDDETGKAIRYLSNEKTSPVIRFPTDSGKARFLARPYVPPAELPDADFPFALTTGRLAHQWHTLTKTGKIASLNKLNPGPFVEMHTDDVAELDALNGDLIKVSSRRGFAIYPVKISDRVRPGDCFVPFHWNDLFGENLTVNAVTNDAVDEISLQPEFKFCAVALAKVALPAQEEFTPQQKDFLYAFIAEVSERHGEGAKVPRIPAAAPFTATQRIYINELVEQILAGK
jgi:sulfite reductase (NADPH) flavoprotein alpha-component